ncbi:MAG: hypothetical protein J7494_09945 [Sphingobium sp.]|nr:hypothetical protein [Sphingobium sp.]
MSQLDERLKGALDADDEAFLRRLDEERGLFAQFGDTLAGPLGGWAKLALVNSIVLVAVIVFAVWQMIAAPTDHALILWTAAFLAAFVAQGLLKLWFFQRMNLITVLRELKRIELRVARIEER